MNRIAAMLGRYLSIRFEEKNREEGRTYEDPLTWREIAQRMGVPENNLLRWKSGLNVPSNPEQMAALVNEFGPYVLVILGLIPPELAVLLDDKHKDDPRVREILTQVRDVSHSLDDIEGRNRQLSES